MKKKILITGGTGFIGKNLIKLLYDENEIYCLSRKRYKHKKINYIKANIFNFNQIKFLIKKIKPEYLVHLAWEAEPKKYLHKQINLRWVEASKNLFYNFCKNKGKKAILIGSIIENDLCNKILFEKEIDIDSKKEKSVYSLSKIKFYFAAKKISKKYKTKFTWVRIPWLYGSYEKKQRLIPKLIYSLKNDKKMKIHNPNNSINILHVEDIANIIYLLIFNKINGVFNLAAKKTTKIKNIINILLKIMKKKKNSLIFEKSSDDLNFEIETKKIYKIKYNLKYNLKNGLEKLIK